MIRQEVLKSGIVHSSDSLGQENGPHPLHTASAPTFQENGNSLHSNEFSDENSGIFFDIPFEKALVVWIGGLQLSVYRE